jgi:hypothetical protein
MTTPVYISLTSIFKNQDILLQTLQSITNQTKSPNKIFLFLSEESYLLDSGFKNKIIENRNLSNFIQNNQLIEVKWVKNIGSYRKLLPLLKEKWNEDCIIITIDDDTVYDSNLIKNFVDDYNIYKCVIGYRGFTPFFDKIDNFNYCVRARSRYISSHNFLTGKGGALYKPEFFHKTDNLIFDEDIYLKTCDKHDDIWFYILRIINRVNCYIGNKIWMKRDLPNNGLYVNFNSKNNSNTIAFQRAITEIAKKTNYKF